MLKLVRVDDENHQIVELSEGKQVIGREHFFDCEDKRISRNHAELETKGDAVLIKAGKGTQQFTDPSQPLGSWCTLLINKRGSGFLSTHTGPARWETDEIPLDFEGNPMSSSGRNSSDDQEEESVSDIVEDIELHTNPCFYINKEMTDAKLIKQNCVINGAIGGKLGFLPGKFWFEIVNKEINEVKLISIKDFQPVKDIISRHKEIADALNSVEKVDVTNTKDQTNDNVSETNGEIKREEKLKENNGLVTVETSETSEEPSGSPSTLSQKNTKSVQTHQSDEETSQTPGKRCLLKREPTSPIDIKKVKTDESRPQSSGDQASSSGASSAASDTSPSKDKPRKRERCMYGANCYRKNPQHKAQFSHPADPDWGVGAQAPCPWGYACARRDPRHWRDHTHPYGMHPPPPAGIQKRKTHIVQRNGKRKRRVKKNSDEESPVDGIIVTGKRARKTRQIETWSGTESEEDPYQTDDSEDWTPPSDQTESQDFSQTSQID